MSVLKTTMEVLERLSSKSGKPVMILSSSNEKLELISSMIDDMVSEFEAETYTVSVVPEDLAMEINIELPEMIIEDCSEHNFFRLIEMVDTFSFSVKEDYLNISLRVDNLFYIAG